MAGQSFLVCLANLCSGKMIILCEVTAEWYSDSVHSSAPEQKEVYFTDDHFSDKV